MFTNVLAFSLTALALVGAAPSFQTPMSVSCNVNFGTVADVGAAKSFGGIPPGRYIIINAAAEGALRSYRLGEPVFRTLTREFPGDSIYWDVKPASSNSYTISNVGLRAPTYIDGDRIRCDRVEPAQYSISPVLGDFDVFTIKTDGDKVWGTDGNYGRAEVHLLPEVKGRGEMWRFIPLRDFQTVEVDNGAF
ncbi:hypothetical protein B0H16DRAFT_1525086 [Mycena metata]|uniref:Uncharacterized protein n=1 Tax=Mycena metata TaxID=1033252 RepID=A0AAD7NKS4_9AGAR|nr:hypothetical protein B0H16DRAFT_1525086 [Mycena metata]